MPANTIRPAVRADLEAAVELWRLLQDEHEALEPRLRRSESAERRWRSDFGVWVRAQSHAVLVADSGEGEVVGLITAHPYWPAPVYEERPEVYVNELIVEPRSRGRGIGRRLVEEVAAWAQGQGVALLRAGVVAANPEALDFWRRVGADSFIVTVALSVCEPADRR